jgi:predicted GNAT family N-acyltransferase|tara:strand:- start:11 stop:430 length:420 start_codon:yes stop_codon:yes gene_type:complete
MGINVKYVDNDKEIDICLSIRRKVFVEEQNIPENIEMDDELVQSIYVCAILDKQYVGTARYRETSSGIKLERFAVLKEYRGLGVGKALVKFILDNLDQDQDIYLHAQEAVVDFYLLLGFKKVNDRFYEAEIPHWKMIKK